jgi:hypothetical protein
MHTDLLRHYIATEAPPKYINYGPGQVEKDPWKRKALFQNARIRFDDLSSYYGAFRESLRKPLSKRISVYITTGEYARAEILIRLLRFYPKSGLKIRVRGTIRKVLRI